MSLEASWRRASRSYNELLSVLCTQRALSWCVQPTATPPEGHLAQLLPHLETQLAARCKCARQVPDCMNRLSGQAALVAARSLGDQSDGALAFTPILPVEPLMQPNDGSRVLSWRARILWSVSSDQPRPMDCLRPSSPVTGRVENSRSTKPVELAA
jgi:hypothetical protein